MARRLNGAAETYLIGMDVEYSYDDMRRQYLFRDLVTKREFRINEDWIAVHSIDEFADYVKAQLVSLNRNLQSPDTGGKDTTMLEQLIRMYNAAMRMNVRSVIPHLVGPPGTNKSGVMKQLADAAGVKLHTVNVSRISPLEIEGVQMPQGEGVEQKLVLLLNTLWSNLSEGDIVLYDEFLRGFPEVYNGLLDIITSREVAGFKLPKVFFVAASNSVATYDKALEDRLLHIYVPDLRSSISARTEAKKILAADIGLIPEVVKSTEMDELFTKIILPTYKMLDYFQGKASIGQVQTADGKSIRNLVGQAHLRFVQDKELQELIVLNNQLAMSQRKWQYVIMLDGKHIDPKYVAGARKLVGNPNLSEVQANNLSLNLDIVDIEEAMKETLTTEEVTVDDEDIV